MSQDTKHDLILIANIIAMSTSCLYFLNLAKTAVYPWDEIIAGFTILLFFGYLACWYFLNNELH